jgi:hypothetical protein
MPRWSGTSPRKCEQRDICIESSFKPDTQFAETGKPGMGSLDNAAMAAENLVTLDRERYWVTSDA